MVSSADYTVRLERVFQGPMDLLLHLVREQEVEIADIAISKIVAGYLAYLEKLESLDIEVAGDFLVMAATLMAIKSRSLLPNEEIDLEEEIDPREELIQRLIEYRRFRDAADGLGARFAERARQTDRGWHEDPGSPERSFDLGELTAWDLFATYSRLMRETLADQPHHVVADPRPLRFYVDRVVEQLRGSSALTLRRLLTGVERVPPREATVGCFCALLELVRLELIDVRQETDEDDIAIAIRPEHQEDIQAIVEETVLDEEALIAARQATETDETEAEDEGESESG